MYAKILIVILIANIRCEKSKVKQGLVSQYPDHMLIIHYDNSSFHDLEALLDGSNKPRTLYNYDTADILLRPRGFNFIHVVFLREWKAFNRFAKIETNIKYNDVILFITKLFNGIMTGRFYYEGIENANAVFIFDMNRTIIYNVQFFNDNDGLVTIVPLDDRGVPDLSAYGNTFNDFDDFELKVAFSNCVPYIYSTVENGNYTVEGIEYEVLKLMEEMLNFKIVLVDFSNHTLPRTSMIQAVHEKKIHVAMGCLSNTIKRNRLVDFTSDIHMEKHIALYSSSGYKANSFFILVTPFQLEVWLYLYVAIALMGLLIKKMVDFILGFQEVDCFDYIKIPFRTIVEQYVVLPSNKYSLRIVFLSWILFTMIITNSYKSKLSASLIKPATREPGSLKDLVDNNFRFEIPSNDPTFLTETLSDSNDPTFNKLLDSMNVGLGLCAAIKKTLVQRVVVIDELTALKFTFWEDCAKTLTKRQINTIRLAKEHILDNTHAWALQKAAPYNKRFTMGLETLQSAGLISAWYQQPLLQRPITISNQDLPTDERNPLNLEILFAPFAILLVGAAISGLIFIGELIHYRYHHNGINFIF